MENLFLTIVNMSITATWAVLAFTLLRPLLKKMPKWINCLLWGVVGLRLCLPFSLESVFSLIPSTETIPTNITYSSSPQLDTGFEVVDMVSNRVITDVFVPNPSYSANPLQIVVGIASYIWLVGVVLMLLYSVVSYLILKKKVSASLHYNNNIYFCDNIETPFILGLINPKIYIPSGVNESDLEFIIEHEKSHLKRKDYLIKPLSFLLLSVYWFNPAIWLWYILLCRDIESACDEKAIKFYDDEYKKLYSTALLNCSTQKRIIMACPVAFGETGVKQRIKAVLNYKNPAFWVVGVAIVLTIWLSIFFVTNPQQIKFEEIIEGDDYKIIHADTLKLSFTTMGDNITTRIPIEDSYYYKNRVALGTYEDNKTLYLEKIELTDNSDEILLTFSVENSEIKDNGEIYSTYYKNSIGEYVYLLNKGDSVVFDDAFGDLGYYTGEVVRVGTGTEFVVRVSKGWIEKIDNHKINISFDFGKIAYTQLKFGEKSEFNHYIYATSNTGEFIQIKDAYYYAEINKTLDGALGLYFREDDGDMRFVCELGSNVSQSILVENVLYYKNNFKIYEVELSENAQSYLLASELYNGETFYSIEKIELVSDDFVYCEAKHYGLREEYPDWDLVYLKINRRNEKFEEITASDIPKVTSKFISLLPDIESTLNALSENIYVQKMNFKFNTNGSFSAAFITVQFYDETGSNTPRIGNVLVVEDLTVFFNEYTEFNEVKPVDINNLTTIDKVLEKVDVIDGTNFCLSNIEKTPENFQLIYFGKTLLKNGVVQEEPYTLYYDSLTYVSRTDSKAKYYNLSGYKYQEVLKPSEVNLNNPLVSGKEYFIITPYYKQGEAPYLAFESDTSTASNLMVIYFDELTKNTQILQNTQTTPTTAVADYFNADGERVFEYYE